MSAEQDVEAGIAELLPTFGNNSLLLYAMGLRLGTSEYEELYRDNVLDGSDDKKVDFYVIDREEAFAVIAQDFESPKGLAADAPANKAADLNTAISWMLHSDLKDIPRESVRAAAEELRDALGAGEIRSVEVYFVHNCTSTKNVDDELKTIQASLQANLEPWAAKAGNPIAAVAKQLGFAEVVGLYGARHSSIVVTDDIHLTAVTPPQEITGPGWKALSTTLRASQLAELVGKYGDNIYSANIRDYLGVRVYARNINQQIARTAKENPTRFWVFNNGVTMITRRVDGKKDKIKCSGLAVVNGAQTIGTLAEVGLNNLSDVLVPARVIEAQDQELIQQIIRFNNTQNPIKPWELRVLDPVQTRIREEFERVLGINYQFRRGLNRRAPNDVLVERLGPWLNSFYGDPSTSHRNSPELFDNDLKYRSLFNEASNIRHLLFVYRLGEAIAATKDEYREAVAKETASETEAKLYSFFRFGIFTHLALFLAAETLTELYGGGAGIKGRFALTEELERNREKSIEVLKRLVKFSLAPIPSELGGEDPYATLRSIAGQEQLGSRVRVSVNQMRSVDTGVVERLKEGIVVI
jgi:hypothetical protein